MKRRAFMKLSAAAGLCAIGAGNARAAEAQGKGRSVMRAGFASECITPPVGTTMMGFGTRDMERGCDGAHDDIFVRALYLEHGGETALIMGFDLCFLGREEVDRYKGAIGRHLDLLPRQILMNTSHNHVGPSAGTWYSAGYECPDRLYLNDLEAATVRAACRARESAREAAPWAGVTRSRLPVNRRRKMADGSIENRPNPTGYAYDKLPICLLKDAAGEPICLVFSVSAHPSMMSGWEISAEYPGAAVRLLDEHLGTQASLFLQGVGGDAKPEVIGRGGVDRWQTGTWELMEEAGAMVAGEVIGALDEGLTEVKPALACASTEMEWALQDAPPREEFQAVIDAISPEERERSVRCMWAQAQIRKVDRGDTLPASVTLTAHGIRLGEGLRIVGIEGEATAPWGKFIEEFYGSGVTFPLGYTDGTGLYLPNSAMLPEGGYEVESAWEYGYPAGFKPGMEDAVRGALVRMRDRGVV